ncbi:recombination protein RecR [candidate division WOR-3 bacterium]|nr:recombination protein RecR [candidate division WOR-3 bacterium]
MSQTLEKLITVLSRLPGIGKKSAQRIAFHLLKNPSLSQELEESLTRARQHLRLCSICFNITEDEVCAICADANRNPRTICVVEEPADVLVIEQTGQYRGRYHILGGVISPLDNVPPESLHIKELLARVQKEGITEVIIATNPTTEGEASAIYIAQLLKPLNIQVTRIARGLPVGSDLELADRETIARALEGRQAI